ncbi:unnamed protein product, partial [Protopolystoma xenopodis]
MRLDQGSSVNDNGWSSRPRLHGSSYPSSTLTNPCYLDTNVCNGIADEARQVGQIGCILKEETKVMPSRLGSELAASPFLDKDANGPPTLTGHLEALLPTKKANEDSRAAIGIKEKQFYEHKCQGLVIGGKEEALEEDEEDGDEDEDDGEDELENHEDTRKTVLLVDGIPLATSMFISRLSSDQDYALTPLHSAAITTDQSLSSSVYTHPTACSRLDSSSLSAFSSSSSFSSIYSLPASSSVSSHSTALVTSKPVLVVRSQMASESTESVTSSNQKHLDPAVTPKPLPSNGSFENSSYSIGSLGKQGSDFTPENPPYGQLNPLSGYDQQKLDQSLLHCQDYQNVQHSHAKQKQQQQQKHPLCLTKVSTTTGNAWTELVS